MEDEQQLEEGKGDLVVVDDEEAVRSAVKDSMAEHGFNVIEAESADHALRIFEMKKWTWRPYAILVDLVMPGLGGYEFLRRISSKYRGKGVPIIVISKLTTGDDIIEAQNAGAHAYIRKPFKANHILEALEKSSANMALSSEERDYQIAIIN